MESNERYYRRRAIQEMTAARLAVTEGAKQRRRELAEGYVRRLAELTGSDERFLLDSVTAHQAQLA
ncbi:hypothetical protein [Sphingomonas sp. S2-65]|uniref:hypothetical protein n=1 Tax=Sphingomonas sp. S2-65 TaxID=2903960 RepID=UPI001F418AF5|nr:hypothetical protein [Sphingomonas sp. S2-65]UYY60141.1 hypothetical protein LZ586_08705 [Sphingomonas sp. S2-65]